MALTNAAVGTVSVIDDPEREGNKYLRIHKSSASSATLGLAAAAEQNLGGTVTIEARVARTTTNGTPNQLAMYSYAQANWNAGNPAGSTNPAATFGFAGGKIMTHNVTGASAVRNAADYTVGQWYTVRNVANLDSGTFDLYINDMSTPVLRDQPLRTQVAELDRFLFFINGSNVGDLLIDYFRVNTGDPFDYNDAGLGSLSLAAGNEQVPVTTSADGLVYSGSVGSFTETVSITALPASEFAAITINGTPASDGQAVEVALPAGNPDEEIFVAEIPVVVTAEDGTAITYTIAVSRLNPNQSSTLRALSVTGAELTPAFDPNRSGTEGAYALTQEVEAENVSIAWQRGWEGQPVQINGDDVDAETSTATVALNEGANTITMTVGSFTGDFTSYVVHATRAVTTPEPDTQRPTTSLMSPSTAGPFAQLTLQLDASDDQGLSRLVANIYQDGRLVRSTQSQAGGATTATHTATVTLPSGNYTLRYNAQDLAGNISQTKTHDFTIDAEAPTATIKETVGYTTRTGETYDLISFKLYDAGKIDRVELNGKVKDLTNNAWSDVNFIKPPTFGAVRGVNTLVVFDVAGNSSTYTFTLN